MITYHRLTGDTQLIDMLSKYTFIPDTSAVSMGSFDVIGFTDLPILSETLIMIILLSLVLSLLFGIIIRN